MWWRNSKASRLRRAHGRVRFWRRDSPAMSPIGWMNAVLPAMSPGCGCVPATAVPMAKEGRHRCGRRRSRCYRGVMPAFGRHCSRAMWPCLPSPRAQLLADSIKEHGASFFDELMDISGLLRSQVEEALAELVALGLVTSDSFGGLRALLVPSSERRTGANGRRRRRTASFGMESAGRWALVRRSAAAERNGNAVEHVARTLLARYGVVFSRLLEREAAWLPPWRELLRVYRRLESRGEVRGGRFVAGFSGEQFALPEAIGMLRATRRQKVTDHWVSVSGADPLNLVGVLTPGPKLPALAGNRLLYRDGIPTAVLAAGDIEFLETLDDATGWTAQKALLRGPVHAPSILPSANEQAGRREAAVNEPRGLYPAGRW